MPKSIEMGSLQRIALGETSPDDALREFEAALQSDDHSHAVVLVYEAARSLVWKIVSSPSAGVDARDWYDVLRRLAARVSTDFEPEWTPRLLTLAELVSETIKFAAVNPVTELINRGHVRNILLAISEHGEGNQIRRRDLKHKLKLGESNLSRILATMVAARLVSRSFEGKEAVFNLTPTGTAALRPAFDPSDPVIIDPPIAMARSVLAQ